MAASKPSHDPEPGGGLAHRRIGVVVHPSRAVEGPLRALRQWTEARGFDIVQVAAACQQQQVADRGRAEECDLIVSIGGDGTSLAALRAGADAERPVLGVAYGSLGVLTSVAPDGVAEAVERFSHGDWVPRCLPGLAIVREGAGNLLALNDFVIVRAGEGQVRVSAYLDGVLFARFAGDGCVVSTPVGSSAYSLSAGGPLLAPHMRAFLLTALPAHGGFSPPLVVSGDSELRLEATAGFGGARLELDGQVIEGRPGSASITLQGDVATVVSFDDQEPLLTGLRRRRIILDSPRIVADDAE